MGSLPAANTPSGIIRTDRVGTTPIGTAQSPWKLPTALAGGALVTWNGALPAKNANLHFASYPGSDALDAGGTIVERLRENRDTAELAFYLSGNENDEAQAYLYLAREIRNGELLGAYLGHLQLTAGALALPAGGALPAAARWADGVQIAEDVALAPHGLRTFGGQTIDTIEMVQFDTRAYSHLIVELTTLAHTNSPAADADGVGFVYAEA